MLTCSCYHQFKLFSNDAIKDTFVQQLDVAKRRLKFGLFAWVIMPDHVHLIVLPDPPGLTVSMILSAIKRPFARRVLARWRQLDAEVLKRVVDSNGKPHFWQVGGGHDRNLVADGELTEKIDYVHQNPIRRELTTYPWEWKWSSAAWYERKPYVGPEIDEHFL